MQIIINNSLRKLKKKLNQRQIKYSAFMLSKELLNIPGENEKLSFLEKLSNYNLTEETFKFLITLYLENKNVFTKVLTLMHHVTITEKEINIYYNHKDVFELLVDMKNNNASLDCLNQEFIDKWGSRVIQEVPDILVRFDNLDIEKYLDIIKNNPSILRDIVPLTYDDNNKKYLGKVIELTNYIDVKEVIHNLVNIKNDYLKKFYIDNYDNVELKRFLNIIVNHYEGVVPV